MTKLILAILMLPSLAGAACTVGGSPLNLQIPTIGDSGSVWGPCLVYDFNKISTAAVVNSTTTNSVMNTLAVRYITGIATGTAGISISSAVTIAGSSLTVTYGISAGSGSFSSGVTVASFTSLGDASVAGVNGITATANAGLFVHTQSGNHYFGYENSGGENSKIATYDNFRFIHGNAAGGYAKFQSSMTIAGLLGLGTTTPGTKIHLSSGVLTVDGNTSGVVISSGNSTGQAILGHFSASASLDFGATAAGTCDLLTIALPGASDGDTVAIGIPAALATSSTYQEFTGYISAQGVCTIKRCNLTNATTALANPAAATVRCDAWRH